MNKTIIELREEAIKEDKNPEFYLYQKLEEKDKEIERLKAREQECIDKYLVESKYRSEIEGKYVVDEYIINELEKDAKENIRIGKNKGYQYVSNLKELLTAEEIYDYISYNCGLYIIEQLDKLKSLKEGK